MSFRIEEKISFKNLNAFEFKKWIFDNGGKILFPARIINSLYFDNNKKMFDQSIEGIVPRKKIRIRTYGTKNFFLNSKKYQKEIKTTYYNNRFKIVEKYDLNFKKLNSGIYDNNYGLCKPNVNVVYKRNYFEVLNTRITLDEDVRYRQFKNGKISNFDILDNQLIIEIKSPKINNTDFLKDIIPLPRSRFSKYCRGVELLNI